MFQFLFVFLCIIFTALNYHDIFKVNEFYITRTIACYPFFAFGNIFRNYDLINKFKEKCNRNLYIIASIFVFCSIVLATHQIGNWGVDIFHYRFGKSVTFFYFSAFILTFCLLIFCLHIPHKIKFITDISDGTLLILGIHMFIIEMTKPIVLFQTDFTKLLLLFVILMICWPIITKCRKSAPLLLGKNVRK